MEKMILIVSILFGIVAGISFIVIKSLYDFYQIDKEADRQWRKAAKELIEADKEYIDSLNEYIDKLKEQIKLLKILVEILKKEGEKNGKHDL